MLLVRSRKNQIKTTGRLQKIIQWLTIISRSRLPICAKRRHNGRKSKQTKGLRFLINLTNRVSHWGTILLLTITVCRQSFMASIKLHWLSTVTFILNKKTSLSPRKNSNLFARQKKRIVKQLRHLNLLLKNLSYNPAEAIIF